MEAHNKGVRERGSRCWRVIALTTQWQTSNHKREKEQDSLQREEALLSLNIKERCGREAIVTLLPEEIPPILDPSIGLGNKQRGDNTLHMILCFGH